jgi:hypothetical protein
MTTLGIVLKKVSPTHHAFTMVFEGGGKETVELETKTYLYHDLLHFAVESEAGLSDSFYGRLLKGYRYDELSLPEMPTLASGGDHEGLMTERIVGLMTVYCGTTRDPKKRCTDSIICFPHPETIYRFGSRRTSFSR